MDLGVWGSSTPSQRSALNFKVFPNNKFMAGFNANVETHIKIGP